MILLLNIPRSKLEKGQKLMVTLLTIQDTDKIDMVVFYEKGSVYAYAKMHGISVEKLDIIKIFTNEELGVDRYRRAKLDSFTDDMDATFINWDYPICFQQPIEYELFIGAFRLAPPTLSTMIRKELERMEK